MKIKVIIGPTASGKTQRAIEFAVKNNGLIINCDSLQVYDELKILTAFPSKKDLDIVPHRLFGYLKYNQQTSVVEWASLAVVVINEAFNQGYTPIITGGTGLYLKTLISGISPIPEISVINRAIASQTNFEEICNKLYDFDPELQNLFPKEKHHQLIRAYEVYLETGKSIRYFRSLPKIKFIENVDFDIEILNIERNELYKRIESRFDSMLEGGAVDEVFDLVKRINMVDKDKMFEIYPIFKAIGAKEITLYLEGKYTYSEMREQAIKSSRHYAKRQITWFRHQVVV